MITARFCGKILWPIIGLCAALPLHGQRALLNLSFRGQVATDARPLANFTVEGSGPKAVIVRGVGPTLSSFGINGALADPKLTLYNGAGAVVTTNSAWGGSTALASAMSAVGAFPLPAGSRDAAVLLTLNAGTYTVELESASGTGRGVALLEIYDADPAANSRLVYLALQARPGNDVNLTVGFMLAPGSGSTNVLVRALGPALAATGVTDAATDPLFNLFSNGILAGSGRTSGLGQEVADAANVAGLLPLAPGSKDAALLMALPPGPYTVLAANTPRPTDQIRIEIAQVDGNRAASFAPALLVPPRPAQAATGSTVVFAAPAVGRPTPTFQWRKSDTAITGATQSSLRLSPLQISDSGSYAVAMSNSAGTTISAPFSLQATAFSPSIVTPPVAQTVMAGATVMFSVVANGAAPLTYQWLFNGSPIQGATQATLTLPSVTTAAAGDYSVRVTNSVASDTSAAARLTVTLPPPRVYFGNLSPSGSFALLVRGDGTAALIGFARSTRTGFVARDLVVDAAGTFSGTAEIMSAPTSSAQAPVTGTVTSSGVSATLAVANLGFSGGLPVTSGAHAAQVGFYEAGAVGSSARSFMIVGAGGQALVLGVTTSFIEAGAGAIAGTGAFDFNGQLARFTGAVRNPRLEITATPVSGATVEFLGADDRARTETEKLINVSTRSVTRGGAEALAAGFVIRGDEPKKVLVRGIGPTLGAFGVGNALSAARLEVVRNGRSLAVGNDWGAAANAADIAAAARQAGAFPLADDSRDAALLLQLEPGAYTATLTGQGGASGAALIEVYDAASGLGAKTERVINLSSRAFVGAGDDVLIVGFVIGGALPKRVLVRGVGPGLANFGVTGALARPRVALYAGDTVLAQNERWGTSADANGMAAAAAQVGAFPLAPTSTDAGLLLHLAPGAYTARVSGVTGASGIALVEVYEVP